MSEDEVDMLDFNTYESRLFSIFNNAMLNPLDMRNFKSQTPEEEINEMLFHIEQAKKRGFDV